MTAVAGRAPYRHCEAVTRANARNFYYGIRLLPRSRRSALCAVYSFARRIDDIADGSAPEPEKLAALEHAGHDIRHLGEPTSDQVLLALGDAARRYPIPMDAFGDLIEGARMDVAGTRYATYEELILYCRRVAGSIGRLSLGVFSPAASAGAVQRADDLGVAMQLTNILRDVGEDLAAGRVYLPAQDLARFRCELGNGMRRRGLPELIRFEAVRAHAWFRAGLELLPGLDRSSAACVATMAGTYERLLREIERRPHLVLERRLRVPVPAKAWIAARAVAGIRT
jgi:15-cis-phytoene synthase